MDDYEKAYEMLCRKADGKIFVHSNATRLPSLATKKYNGLTLFMTFGPDREIFRFKYNPEHKNTYETIVRTILGKAKDYDIYDAICIGKKILNRGTTLEQLLIENDLIANDEKPKNMFKV